MHRSVPWINSQEWSYIRQLLYSNQGDDQHKAIQRIKAWQARGKVPHAVESTASLIEIQLLDFYANSISEYQLRSLYSMGMIRFVNGFIDPQQKGLYASSMTGIADNIGLPSWFIDLRHSGTHDQLPTLVLLRNACEQALQWLYNEYWIKQDIPLINISDVKQDIPLINISDETVQQDQPFKEFDRHEWHPTEFDEPIGSIKEFHSLELTSEYEDSEYLIQNHILVFPTSNDNVQSIKVNDPLPNQTRPVSKVILL